MVLNFSFYVMGQAYHNLRTNYRKLKTKISNKMIFLEGLKMNTFIVIYDN